jgi:hypothetical protein
VNWAVPEGGSNRIVVGEGTVAAIAGAHEKAAERITGVAGAAPDVDGGMADVELLTILALVLGTADDLAVINQAAAESVRALGANLLGTDAEVASAFQAADPDRLDGPDPVLPPGSLHNPFPPGWGP